MEDPETRGVLLILPIPPAAFRPCTTTSQHVLLPRYTEAIPNVAIWPIYPGFLIEQVVFIAGIVDLIASNVPQSERLVCSLFRKMWTSRKG